MRTLSSRCFFAGSSRKRLLPGPWKGYCFGLFRLPAGACDGAVFGLPAAAGCMGRGGFGLSRLLPGAWGRTDSGAFGLFRANGVGRFRRLLPAVCGKGVRCGWPPVRIGCRSSRTSRGGGAAMRSRSSGARSRAAGRCGGCSARRTGFAVATKRIRRNRPAEAISAGRSSIGRSCTARSARSAAVRGRETVCAARHPPAPCRVRDAIRSAPHTARA